MYGLVNKAVEGLICARFGQAMWEQVRERAGVDDGTFVSMHAYDDDVTYRLVAAASEVLNLSPEAVLEGFGEYWITYTVDEGYGAMLDTFGATLEEFLANLNDLHARIALTMDQLRPPAFRCEVAENGDVLVRYVSCREGLSPMVRGLLRGLVRRFGESIEVSQVATKAEAGADVFALRRTQTVRNHGQA